MPLEIDLLTQTFPNAEALAASNPALAFCIAHLATWDTAYGKGEPVALIRSLLLAKRRRICEFLGFPGSERIVKVLSKIEPEACCVPWLLSLRRKLREEPGLLELLLHVSRIDRRLLFLAANWRWGNFVTPALYRELADHCDGRVVPEAGRLLADTIKMSMRDPDAHRVRFRSLGEVQACHDRLVQRNGDQTTESGFAPSTRSFPSPPLLGTTTIQPLESAPLLEEEGRKQHHCAGVFADQVAEREMYFYKMLAPERATVSLERTSSGWILGDLKAACNREVRPETRQHVEDWLRAAQNNPNRHKSPKEAGRRQ